MARKRRTCTPELKAEAVKLVTERGYSVAEAARSLGVHETLLRTWKQTLEAQGDPAFPATASSPPSRRSCVVLAKAQQRIERPERYGRPCSGTCGKAGGTA
jgi:transposase